MKKRNKIIINLIILAIFTIILIPQTVEAFDTGSIAEAVRGNTSNVIENKFKPVTDQIGIIGAVVSVIALIAIGLKYMMSSVEEKAEYKETMTPYLIGVTFVFAILAVITAIKEVANSLNNTNSVESAGNVIITILTTIGSFLSVIVLVVLGIKYMAGSVEEKAEYKRTLTPYIIGCIIVFAASTIAGMIVNLVAGF